ncbi:hypothetical protein CEW89_15375 [Celeribacter ethanolicus]|uniref:Recombinase zinc beta ribbon domain-containing protein n=1 Tax=Celeribacter ethanolicus TaxID=1758178 RepID=A0A291GF67_9RHOB|nr:recombinase zinc beta ribbon domain-containing protein [Celeribacter ethanolicus]ATG48827.1 hypothetical protein CEW89_15375 [Celeribacter ethanolicus]
MVDTPSWGISLCQGFHEPLISYETYCQIQDRLNGKPTAPMRVDIDETFPLRRFLLCEDCGKPMTACFSTSQTGAKHPYYWCKTKGCPSHRKSIRRAKVEEDFEAFLGTLQPTKGFFDLLQRMVSDAWAARSALENMSREDAKRQLVKLNGQIANLVERIMDSNQPAVIAAYEKKISALEQEKLVMKERIQTAGRKNTQRDVLRTRPRIFIKPTKDLAGGEFCVEADRLKIGLFGANYLFPRERYSNSKNYLTIQGFRGVSGGKM